MGEDPANGEGSRERLGGLTKQKKGITMTMRDKKCFFVSFYSFSKGRCPFCLPTNFFLAKKDISQVWDDNFSHLQPPAHTCNIHTCKALLRALFVQLFFFFLFFFSFLELKINNPPLQRLPFFVRSSVPCTMLIPSFHISGGFKGCFPRTM